MPKKTPIQLAAALLGSIKTEKKAASSRANAKKPRKRNKEGQG